MLGHIEMRRFLLGVNFILIGLVRRFFRRGSKQGPVVTGHDRTFFSLDRPKNCQIVKFSFVWSFSTKK